MPVRRPMYSCRGRGRFIPIERAIKSWDIPSAFRQWAVSKSDLSTGTLWLRHNVAWRGVAWRGVAWRGVAWQGSPSERVQG